MYKLITKHVKCYCKAVSSVSCMQQSHLLLALKTVHGVRTAIMMVLVTVPSEKLLCANCFKFNWYLLCRTYTLSPICKGQHPFCCNARCAKRATSCAAITLGYA